MDLIMRKGKYQIPKSLELDLEWAFYSNHYKVPGKYPPSNKDLITL